MKLNFDYGNPSWVAKFILNYEAKVGVGWTRLANASREMAKECKDRHSLDA